MKRSVLIIIVLVALLLLGTPAIIGWIAERSIDEGMEVAKEQPSDVTISEERFDRGWFSSEGRHRFELNNPEMFPQMSMFADRSGYPNPPALIIDSTLDHGIIPVTSMQRHDGSPAPGLGQMTAKLSFDPGNGELVELPGVITGRVGLTGTTTGTMTVEAGEWSDGENQLEWSNAVIDFSADPTGTVVDVSGFIEPMRLAYPGGGAEIGRITVDVSQKGELHGLMVGEASMTTERITARDSYGIQTGVGSFSLDARSAEEDAQLTGQLSMAFTEFIAPAMGAVDMQMYVSFANIDAESFAALQDAYQAALEIMPPDRAWQALYPDMEAELQRFFAAGPELRIDKFALELPVGTITQDFELRVPEQGDGDAFSWPGLLLKAEASMNFSVPAPVFEMIKAMQPEAETLIAMGFVVQDGDNFVSSIQYAKGLVTVNGLPMPVPLPGM